MARIRTFIVSAPRGTRFPVDMLRYDSCWPKLQEDANVIQWAIAGERDEGIIVITLETVGTGAPTVERWRSFGWSIGQDAAEKLYRQVVQ